MKFYLPHKQLREINWSSFCHRQHFLMCKIWIAKNDFRCAEDIIQLFSWHVEQNEIFVFSHIRENAE